MIVQQPQYQAVAMSPAQPLLPKSLNMYSELNTHPTIKEHVVWLILSASNLFLALYNLNLAEELYRHGMADQKYLSLLGEFDDGVVHSMLITSFVATAGVCMYGCIATSNISIFLAAANARISALSYLTMLKVAIIFTTLLLLITHLVKMQVHEIAGNLDKSIIDFSLDVSTQKKLQVMQAKFNCCGFYDHKDYFRVTWSEGMTKTQFGVPKSCCVNHRSCIHVIHPGDEEQLSVNQKGCKESLHKLLETFFNSAFKKHLINMFLLFALYILTLTNLGTIKKMEKVLLEITIQEAKEAVDERKRKQNLMAIENKRMRRELYQKDYARRKFESDKAKKERMTKIAQELITERLRRTGALDPKASPVNKVPGPPLASKMPPKDMKNKNVSPVVNKNKQNAIDKTKLKSDVKKT